MKQAMLLAAGLGTRLRPLTDTMPKALVPVAGRPLLHHIILRLKQAGFQRIVVNIHHFGQQIIDDLAANHHFGLDIRISDERDLLLDTGGALRHAAPHFDPSSPVLVHNVDILSNADLSALYQSIPAASEQSASAAPETTAASLLVSQRSTSRYLLFSPTSHHLLGWTNKATGELRGPIASDSAALPSALLRAFSGIHLLSPALFPLMASWPEKFSIIDFYLSVCSTHTIQGFVQPGLRLLDVGKIDSLADADTFLTSLP